MRTFSVELPGRSYPVVVGEGAAARLPDHCEGRALVVKDAAVELGFEPPGPVVELAGGEWAKTLAGYGLLLGALEDAGLGRDGTLVAVGGGSITDVAGFAAATWQRGIRLVNVPTTLLGMVDAALGGKTGINGAAAKNAVGAFWQPVAVLCDLRYLATVPALELRSAMAEVVKYDLTLDPGVSSVTEQEEMVARCAIAKARVVAADEREEGARAVLNYGHTAGHAIEAEAGYAVPHGVAVAAGMRVAARLAEATGLAPPGLAELHDRLLGAHGLPGALPALDPERVAARLNRDKKARGGRPRWVLLREPGRPELGVEVADALAADVLAEILAR